MESIRADHVGSLLRPASLLEKRQLYKAGKITFEELEHAEDAAILEIIRKQEAIGLDVVTDGEFRRSSFLSGTYDALDGLEEPDHSFDLQWHGDGEKSANADRPMIPFIAARKLVAHQRITGREAPFLRKQAKAPYKVTMAGPTMYLNMFQPGVTDQAYTDPAEMLADLVSIYQNEIDDLVANHVGCIQLDSLRYTAIFGGVLPPGTNANEVLTEALEADNAIFGRAKGKAIRSMHLCRGNHRSAWLMQGSYEPVAERLFQEADVDQFMLEFDDDRSGGFAPLRFVPKGKTVVLGLVTSKSPALESQDQLLKRISEAEKHLPLEQLALSPQCGFASTELGNILTEDDQWRKLELVVDTARKVWS